MTHTSHEFKIVVAGPFGVGKTTLISNISSSEVVGTEVPTTGDEAYEKDSTTLGLEYGRLEVRAGDYDIKLLLFGTPGQARFRFMWDVISVGADGFVILVDASRPETWAEASEMASYFIARHAHTCIVGANRTDVGTDSYERLVDFLDVEDIPVIPCNVTDERSSRDLIVELLSRLIGQHEAGEALGAQDSTDRPFEPDSNDYQDNGRDDHQDPDLGAVTADGSHWAAAGGN